MDYHQDYDEVDAPLRQRKPKAKNSFQRELDATIKQRRNLGLAADVTTSEGSGEEDELIRQYTQNHSTTSPSRQRPGSAKKRPQRQLDTMPNLDETLRPRDAGNILGRGGRDDHRGVRDDHLDQEVASYANRNLPNVGRKTPSPRSDSLLGRKTPTGKKTPTNEGLTKEDIIFGRKTPTQGGLPDSLSKKPWTPPTYQKPAEMESGNRTPSPAGSRGRNTPSSLLDPISESTTPRGGPRSSATTPRGDGRSKPRLTRQPSTGSDKSPRQLSIETSPRSDRPAVLPRGRGQEGEGLRGRTTPTMDLFGKTRQDSLLDEVEEKPEKQPRFRRGSGDGRKTPPGRSGISGRKTPERTLSGRKTPESLAKIDGRKTPTGGKKFTGRKTPTEEREVEEKKPEKSLLDFLTEDTTPKPEPRQRRKSKPGLSKEGSGDSISNEIMQDFRRSPPPMRSTNQFRGRRDQSPDKSSVCEELEREPGSRSRTGSAGEEEGSRTRKSGNQTSTHKALDSAISKVAGAQDKSMAFIDPESQGKNSVKKTEGKERKQKPKPRYPTMPGETTPTSEINFEDTASIRKAIYDQWYQQRMETAKKSLVEKKKQEKEEEEKKKKAKEEKETEAKLSYQAWVDQKKGTYFKDKQKQKRQEEMKKEKDRQEQETKRADAKKLFETWKEQKDNTLVQKARKQRNLEEERKQIEEEKKDMKRQTSQTAFRGWKAKKDVVLTKQAREEKVKKRNQAKNEEYDKITRDEEAMDRYQEWLREKEKRDKQNRRQVTLRSEEDYKPAWSPANRTIPFGR
ncbi:protein maph-9-like [Haliotis cracherodii]|uniref:protein maph-9-like n=1 Tax=Haliotis cracherodii TaxID=6455 RepID=UPI0039E79DE8